MKGDTVNVITFLNRDDLQDAEVRHFPSASKPNAFEIRMLCRTTGHYTSKLLAVSTKADRDEWMLLLQKMQMGEDLAAIVSDIEVKRHEKGFIKTKGSFSAPVD